VKLLICKERDHERNRNDRAILDHDFYDRCDGCNGFSNLERLNKERDMIYKKGMMVVDRKTGEKYDPMKELDRLLKANKDVLIRLKNR
jgi:hypothetical protein